MQTFACTQNNMPIIICKLNCQTPQSEKLNLV